MAGLMIEKNASGSFTTMSPDIYRWNPAATAA
jgi:hypothetical protein